jgi:hypothetical protein
MYKKIMLLVTIVFFFIAWIEDPNVNTPVCTAQNAQQHPEIVSDGFDGAIVTWQDNRAGHYDIYAQHLDMVGAPQWQHNGVPLCNRPGIQELPQIVSDGSGGAIVTWQDNRRGNNYDIYAQRISASGNLLWETGGAAICRVSGHQKRPRLIPDGSHGAIIIWQDRRNVQYDIYAQHINGAGNLLWTIGGNPICRAGGDQHEHQLITDGNNGAIISWADGRGSHDDIYAQRIDSSGALQWATDGIALCTAVGEQYEPQIAAKGSGGAIVTWIDKRGSSYIYYIYAQSIDSSGAAEWQENGVRVEYEYSYTPEDLRIIPDGQGGAVISWTDYSCPVQVWVEVERINASGQSLWHDYVTSYYEGYNAQLLPDGSGGAIVTWADDRHGEDGNIRAQHLNNNGSKQWGAYGVQICSRPGSQYGPRIIEKEHGSYIVTWYDGDIYAQNLCDNGGLGGCIAPVAVMNELRYGGIVPADIKFDGSGSFDPDGTITEWAWKFGDGGTGAKEKLTHTYPQVGLYWVTLQVKDDTNRWSAKTRSVVKTYALDNLEAKLSLNQVQVKAYGKGRVQVNSSCYEKNVTPGREERPVPVNLGLKYSKTAGTWFDDMIFGSGLYSKTLTSSAPGTVTVKAILQGKVLGTIKIEFSWPQPPVNLAAELKTNRSLLRGEYFAYLSWSANTEEIFTPGKYRIYRSTNNGAFELAAEVGASTYTYIDKFLPAGNQYSYAVSMVDSEGDESALSTGVPGNLRGKSPRPGSTTKGKMRPKK